MSYRLGIVVAYSEPTWPEGTELIATSPYVEFTTDKLAFKITHPDLPLVEKAGWIPTYEIRDGKFVRAEKQRHF